MTAGWERIRGRYCSSSRAEQAWEDGCDERSHSSEAGAHDARIELDSGPRDGPSVIERQIVGDGGCVEAVKSNR